MIGIYVGIYDPKSSWEKQSVYNLENGWIATISFSYYGEHVVRLDAPEGQTTPKGNPYWHCSNGIGDLPEFAKDWLLGGEWHVTKDLVTPKFERRTS